MRLTISDIRADIHSVATSPEEMAWIDSLPAALLHIHSTIAAAGGGVWLVGGAVRESMRGRIPNDHDIATTLTPDEVERCFEQTIPTGKRFGTITVVADGINHEVTTLRCETGYSDGRHPDSVQLTTSLSLDLERRDFTINAMAVDLGRRELYDPHGGMSDLDACRLRAVGKASHRLSEDGLRVMRAYRFLDHRDGCEWNTDSALELALIERQSMLKEVANERIWQEFKRILSGPDAGRVLHRMAKDRVLDIILGGIIPADDRRIRALRRSSTQLCAEMRLAVLLQDRSAEELVVALKRLRVSNAVINKSRRFHGLLGTSPVDADDGLLRLFRHELASDLQVFLGLDQIWDEETSGVSSSAYEELRLRLSRLPRNKHVEPLADGDWLMRNSGLGKGERLGRLKSWLHRLQIERDLGSIGEVEEVLCSLPWQHGEPALWPKPTWP